MANYADLEIRIQEKQQQGFPVEMTLNSEQEYGPGFLDPASLPLPWIPSSSLKKDGERLFQWLLSAENLRTAWAEVRGQSPHRRIRLRIDATAPELHALPWEMIRDPGAGATPQDLAATVATPFSRYLAGRWRPGTPVLQRPIKVLVAIANPTNLQEKYKLEAIDVEGEFASLKEVVAGQPVELTLLPQPCTLLAIATALKDGYHVLHFIGHGSFSEKSAKAALLLADDQNQVNLTSDEDVAEMLVNQLADDDMSQDDRLRLVFLASCQTATRSPADAFRGLAPRLIEAGVPAVLAMQDLVPIDTAKQFSASFYSRLMAHGLVDLASNEARSSVLTAKLSGAAIPVLFSRLRSGELFGQRGQIASDRHEEFWQVLLENVHSGHVTAFLGPEVTNGLLSDRSNVAKALAKKHKYPLDDGHDLNQVAQFIAMKDTAVLRRDYLRTLQRSLPRHLDIEMTSEKKEQLRDATLSDTIVALDWSDRVLSIHENEIHHQLADLKLPLYLTTNVDNFMMEALKAKGLSPRREGLRWEQPEAGSPQYVLNPEPSQLEPVVLHLNGHDGDPEQLRRLVLSEDDYLEHFVRLSRDQESILPSNVLTMLAEHSYLFLGYKLDDWEFRTVLQGLVKHNAQPARERKLHVGVQLELGAEITSEAAIKYLSSYMREFNIDIYWGSTQQFMNELSSLRREYLAADVDDW